MPAMSCESHSIAKAETGWFCLSILMNFYCYTKEVLFFHLPSEGQVLVRVVKVDFFGMILKT